MAGISKVTYNDEVLLDLTQDTVNPNVLLSGFTAHAANGDPIGGALVLGALAYLNSISYNSNYLTNKPILGNLASMNLSDLNLRALAHLDKISYLSDRLTEKPQLGDLAFLNTVNYKTQVTEKPVFGDLAFQDSISYESNQLTDKPISYAELMENLVDIYPDMPKGIKLAVSAASGGPMLDSDVLYYAEDGIHVYEAYEEWFTYLPGTAEDGILITVKEKLSDIAKPLFDELGDLAYQNSISYESDQLTDKPISADEIMRSILDIYPDLPVGISSVILASSGHALYAGDSTFVYQDDGIVFNSSNTEGVTAVYDDSGILLGFSPLQFIEDAPDDGKLYARRHGAWAEINI